MDRIGSAEVGGVESYTFRLGEALARSGHEIVLYGGQPRKPLSFEVPGVSFHLLPHLETAAVPDLGTRFRRLVQRLHFAWRSRNELLREWFDAILIFKPYDLITAWLWRRWGLRARVVASIHGPEFYPGDRQFAGSVDAWYAVNHSTARAVENRYGKRCEAIPNFLDGKQIAFPDRPHPPQEKLVITVGRLVGWKGLAHLARAFARIHAGPAIKDPLRLAIIGDGPERSPLETLVRDLRIAQKVDFPGVLGEEELADYRKRAWLHVQPSIGYESFSISTLEALASGVNVLASDQVGIAEWFHSDNVLEVYPASDTVELERRLIRLLSESWAENRERSLRARAVVEKEFTVERVVPRIENLCRLDQSRP